MHSRPKLIPTNFKIIAPPTGRQKHTYTIQQDSVISIIKKRVNVTFQYFFEVIKSNYAIHVLPAQFIHSFFKKLCAFEVLCWFFTC